MSLTVADYFKLIETSPRAGLAKAITLVESQKTSDINLSQKLLKEVLKKPTASIRIGISGIPGVGKSTFIECFGLILIRLGYKVAVLSIDPTSPISGGSILGDKTRMELLSKNDNAFIRPSPSLGALGGISPSTRNSIILCEYCGYDVILIETVGTGQSEFAVSTVSDLFLLLHMPNTGDELQSQKKGVLDLANFIAITKSDEHLENPAKIAKSQLEQELHFGTVGNRTNPFCFLVSAKYNRGIEELWTAMYAYIEETRRNGEYELKRHCQNTIWLNDEIDKQIVNWLRSNPRFKEEFKIQSENLNLQNKTPFEAAIQLIRTLTSES